jgi:hypothetical protein
VIVAGLRTAFRCPALRRAFACGVLLGALAACHFSPRAVEGVPFTEPWLVLPLNRWLAEDRAEPEAMAVCRPPDCGPGLVVAVVRLVGREAEISDAVLSDPRRLVRALVRPSDPKTPVRATASAKTMAAGAAHGFLMTLQRQDGTRPAYGAALGQRLGQDLRVVLVIGEDRETVETTVRRVAREHLGSPDVATRPESL